MIYRAIGVMSGSSLDGLDIAFVEFQENGGKWSYEISRAACYSYSTRWTDRLSGASTLSGRDYQLLHAEYGHYVGEQINQFIAEHQLHYQVALICSHGHTVFHEPAKKMTAQLGDGSAIAAETGLPVVSDLRAIDIAFGGQGAPIVPIGEKMLLGDYDLFLNLGGIANISFNTEPYQAFDICPSNRVLNLLASEAGLDYDDGGRLAATGEVNAELLAVLNALDYYNQSPPKSLANDFGTGTVYPLIRNSKLEIADALRTYVEHIVEQIVSAVATRRSDAQNRKIFVTGGGAFNIFLVQRLEEELKKHNIETIIPAENLIQFKEAMIMAFIGVLRWRQEYNVLSSVTGATRNSINGALWIGQEA